MVRRDSEGSPLDGIRWRVLVVDDDRHHRVICRAALDGAHGADTFVVVGEARDGVTAITHARALQPDLVVLDVRMPGMGGLEAMSQIAEAAPSASIVVWSNEGLMHGDLARELGAHAVVSKLASPDDLVSMLARVARDRMTNV